MVYAPHHKYGVNIRLLCGPAISYELPVFYRALERRTVLDLQTIGIFVPEDLKPYVQQAISKNVLFTQSPYDLFDKKSNSLQYFEVLKRFI